jgi:hypothetical protein
MTVKPISDERLKKVDLDFEIHRREHGEAYYGHILVSDYFKLRERLRLAEAVVEAAERFNSVPALPVKDENIAKRMTFHRELMTKIVAYRSATSPGEKS